MKNILSFHLHRIAARRVRAVTSRLVLFSVDDNWWWWWWWWWWWQLWWRNCFLRASPFQTIIQSSCWEAKSQSDKNREVLSKTFYITTKNEAMKYTFLLVLQKPPLTLFKNDSCKIMIFILKCELKGTQWRQNQNEQANLRLVNIMKFYSSSSWRKLKKRSKPLIWKDQN